MRNPPPLRSVRRPSAEPLPVLRPSEDVVAVGRKAAAEQRTQPWQALMQIATAQQQLRRTQRTRSYNYLPAKDTVLRESTRAVRIQMAVMDPVKLPAGFNPVSQAERANLNTTTFFRHTQVRSCSLLIGEADTVAHHMRQRRQKRFPAGSECGLEKGVRFWPARAGPDLQHLLCQSVIRIERAVVECCRPSSRL